MKRARAAAIGGLALALLLVLVILARTPLIRAGIAAGGFVAGYRIGFGDFHLGSDGAEFRDVRIARGGDPLLEADRIDAKYHVADIRGRSGYLYGVSRIFLDHPHFHIITHADGRSNLPLAAPKAGAPAKASTPTVNVGFSLTASVRDGTVDLINDTRIDARARVHRLERINLELTSIATESLRYRVKADLIDNGVAYPIRGAARVDLQRGFAIHHWSAREVPVASLGNYVINSAAAHVEGGVVSAADLRLFALAGASNPAMIYHLTARMNVHEASLRINPLLEPLEHLNGTVDVHDDGIAARALSGTIVGDAVRISGGIFNFDDPQFRFAIAAHSDLTRVRGLFGFAKTQPLSGPLAVAGLIEGGAGNPLMVMNLVSPRAYFQSYPFEQARVQLAFYNSALQFAPLRAHYGAVDVRLRGSLDVSGRAIRSDLAASFDVPTARLPYAAQLVRTPRLHGTAIAWGEDLKLATQGVFAGEGGGGSARGFFAVGADGRAQYGPIALSGDDGSTFNGTLAYDRTQDAATLWLSARNYRLRSVASAGLPNLALPAIPPIDGLIDGDLAGAGTARALAMSGRLRARDGHVAGVPYREAAANFAGTFNDLRYAQAYAAGPWGRISGAGSAQDGALALRGTYEGSFEALAGLTGDVGAHGRISGPIALLSKNGSIVLQTPGVKTGGATIRNIPLEALAGTIGVTGRTVRVYAGSAQIAGGSAVGAGDTASGVTFSSTPFEARRLAALGVPLTGGTVQVLGEAGNGPAGPTFNGAFAVRHGRYGRVHLAGSAELELSGPRLDVRDGSFVIGKAHGDAAGTVYGVGSPEQRYDLRAQVRGADVAAVAGAFGFATYGLAADADADLRLAGAGARPNVAGSVRIPIGTINGLAFNDMTAQVSADPSGAAARAGSVTVGSTRVAFAASAQGATQRVHLASAAARLADFNNFFDPGDMLAGRGRVNLDAARSGTRVDTAGTIGVNGLRIEHFDLGNAASTWTTRAGVIRGSLSAGGPTGRMDVRGSIAPNLSAGDRSLAHSLYHLRVGLQGLDLGTWLPTLGYEAVPISGRVDGSASLDGRYPKLAVSGNATLIGGALGRVPIERLTVAANSTLARTTISAATLDVRDLHVTASGTAGPGDRLNFSAHARSPQIGTIAERILGRPVDIAGALEAELRIGGTLRVPAISGGFDLESARYAQFAIPRAVGAIALQGRNVALQDLEMTLPHGSVQIAGLLPLQIAPLGLGPAGARLELDAIAKGVDLADFATLFPHGTRLGGAIDGRVGLSGTPAAPVINGGLALKDGSFVAPFEISPITHARAQVTFNGTAASVDRFDAYAGPGRIEGKGTIGYAGMRSGTPALDYRFELAAARAVLNLPAYGRGEFDGKLTLRSGAGPAELGGDINLSNASISYTALTGLASGPAGSSAGAVAGPALPLLGLDLGLHAGSNVRVRGGPVDIGARGNLKVTGTTRDPVLAGRFDSTGGTVTYGNRVFRVSRAAIAFAPELGLVPRIDARATTHVDAGSGPLDIVLGLSGLATSPSLVLQSDPGGYDQQQILALLLDVPALGASVVTPGGLTPAGIRGVPGESNAALPPGVLVQSPGGGFDVSREAFGLLNAQFTRALLSPLENAFGGALGLQDLAFTIDYGGGFGLNFRKLLGHNVYGIYSQTFTYPYRYTYGVELRPRDTVEAQLTFFQQSGTTFITNPASFLNQENQSLTAGQPLGGTSGFSFLLRYLFP